MKIFLMLEKFNEISVFFAKIFTNREEVPSRLWRNEFSSNANCRKHASWHLTQHVTVTQFESPI